MATFTCEAGKQIRTDEKCHHCGAEPGPNSYCRGEKPPHPWVQERKELIEQICQLRSELARYKEREKTMGWADA